MKLADITHQLLVLFLRRILLGLSDSTALTNHHQSYRSTHRQPNTGHTSKVDRFPYYSRHQHQRLLHLDSRPSSDQPDVHQD